MPAACTARAARRPAAGGRVTATRRSACACLEPAVGAAHRAAGRAAARAPRRAPPASASGWNEVSSGGKRCPAHSRAASAATTAPVGASAPGVGLISMFSSEPLCRQKRATSSSVGSGSPAKARSASCPRRAATARPRDGRRRAVAAGGALAACVVHQEGHAVGTQLDVAFEHAVAVLRTQAERRQRVLRRQLAGAPVGDPAGVGPVRASSSGGALFRCPRRTSAGLSAGARRAPCRRPSAA